MSTEETGNTLSADRELSEEELAQLQSMSMRGWLQVMELLALRAKASYSVAHSKVFTTCVQQHLDDEGREEMKRADVFVCPVCATLLKDRQSPVASSILMERKRLAGLWLDVEQAKIEEFDAALDRFRRALGLFK